ncbi:Leucine-rich repeat and fibronectin type-III domain-containing protein 5 [Sparganum proliferum]
MLINLRITQQNIRQLNGDVLKKLIYLEELYVESSELEQVDVNAFRGLTRLRILSLRNNSLRIDEGNLLSATFHHLPSLGILDLSYNPLGFIPPNFFPASVGRTLTELRLEHTKGDGALNMDVSAFFFLEQLRVLDLSFAGLRSLPSDFRSVFTRMENLRELQLGGNPWLCDCTLRWLKDWYLSDASPSVRFSHTRKTLQETHITITPTCSEPYSVHGKQIFGSPGPKTIKLEEFLCKQWISSKTKTVSAPEQSNVSLECHGYSETPVKVQWFKDKHVLTKLSRRYALFQLNSPEFHATLNIVHVAKEDAGLWECALDEGAGQQRASINLTVKLADGSLRDASSGNSQSDLYKQNLMYAGIGIASLFILLGAIALGIFCCWSGRAGKTARVHMCASKFRGGNAYQFGVQSIDSDAREMIGNRAANSRSDSPGPMQSKSPSHALQHINDLKDSTNQNSGNSQIHFLSDIAIKSTIPAGIESMPEGTFYGRICVSTLPSTIEPPSGQVLGTSSSGNHVVGRQTDIPITSARLFSGQSATDESTLASANYADLFPLPPETSYGTMHKTLPISTGLLNSLTTPKSVSVKNFVASGVPPAGVLLKTGVTGSSSPCPLHGPTLQTVHSRIPATIHDPCPIHGSSAALIAKQDDVTKYQRQKTSSFTQTADGCRTELQASNWSRSTVSLHHELNTDLANDRKDSSTNCASAPYVRRDSAGSCCSSYKPGNTNWRNEGRGQSSYRTLPSNIGMGHYSTCPIHGKVSAITLNKRSASVALDRALKSSVIGAQISHHRKLLRNHDECSSCSSTDSVAEGEDVMEDYTSETSEDPHGNSSDTCSTGSDADYVISCTQRHQPLSRGYSSQNSLGSRHLRQNYAPSGNQRRQGVATKRKSGCSSDSEDLPDNSHNPSWNEDRAQRLSICSGNWNMRQSGEGLEVQEEEGRLPQAVFPPRTMIGQPILIAIGEPRCTGVANTSPCSPIHPRPTVNTKVANEVMKNVHPKEVPSHSSCKELTPSSSSSTFGPPKSILVRPRSRSRCGALELHNA